VARNLLLCRPYNSPSASGRRREMSFISTSSDTDAAPGSSRVDPIIRDNPLRAALAQACGVPVLQDATIPIQPREKSAALLGRSTNAAPNCTLRSDSAIYICDCPGGGSPPGGQYIFFC